MNTEIKLTGGARVGWINASWPFATLNVTTSKIILKSLLGKYEFVPSDISSFEATGSILIISQGIKINHNKPEYPEKMIFWTMRNPENVIEQIRMLGFYPRGTQLGAVRAGGFPVRWQAIIIFVVLWNSFMLFDMFKSGTFNPKPGPFAWLAIVLVFILSISIWKSESLQKVIISPGHKLSEIKSFIYLLTIVSGFLSLLFGIELIK